MTAAAAPGLTASTGRARRRALCDFTLDECAEIGRRRRHESAAELARAFDTTVPVIKKIYQREIFL